MGRNGRFTLGGHRKTGFWLAVTPSATHLEQPRRISFTYTLVLTNIHKHIHTLYNILAFLLSFCRTMERVHMTPSPTPRRLFSPLQGFDLRQSSGFYASSVLPSSKRLVSSFFVLCRSYRLRRPTFFVFSHFCMQKQSLQCNIAKRMLLSALVYLASSTSDPG